MDRDCDQLDGKIDSDNGKLELSDCFCFCMHRVTPDHRDSRPRDECDDPRRRILGARSFCLHDHLCDPRCYARELSRLLDREMVRTWTHREIWRLVLSRDDWAEDPRMTDSEKWILVYCSREIPQLHPILCSLHRRWIRDAGTEFLVLQHDGFDHLGSECEPPWDFLHRQLQVNPR